MDVLETPGTRLTSVRFTLTTASRSVAWTVSRRRRIPGRVRLRADYTSRDEIFERLGVERVGARREGERGGGLASAAIRLCFPNETERPWKRIFAWSCS